MNPVPAQKEVAAARPAWWRRAIPARGEQMPRPESSVPASLNWVDEYIANIRDYVVVRLDDHLLIQMPNRVQQINPTGARILHYLLSGGRIAVLCREIGPDTQRLHELSAFLYEVRRGISGELREDNASCAVDIRSIPLHFSKLPVLAEVALTYRCNLRCVFCYAGCVHCSRDRKNGCREMRTSEVVRVLDSIRRQAQVPSVSFTGGEPTLREDLPRLVRYAARKLGMRVNLITNGTMINAATARRLAAVGLASAQVSIEGPDATCHDMVTGVEGSFALSCRAVEHLRAAGIHTHANTTIHRQNIDRMAEMPQFARDVLGVDRLSMNMVIPSGSATEEDTGRESPLLRYSEMAPVIRTVQQAAREVGVEFMWYSPTPLCIFNPITAELGNKGCSACDGLLSVDPYGRILPCSSCEEPVGSLLDESFEALWKNETSRFYQQKEFAHPACRGCDNFCACHGGCPLYWRHFGFEELEQCPGFKTRTQTAPHKEPRQRGFADTALLQEAEA